MNVTLGVPRIKEIFNATETIKTPIIKVRLMNPQDEIQALFIKNQINAVHLEDVLLLVREIYDQHQNMMQLQFNMKNIGKSLLGVR